MDTNDHTFQENGFLLMKNRRKRSLVPEVCIDLPVVIHCLSHTWDQLPPYKDQIDLAHLQWVKYLKYFKYAFNIKFHIVGGHRLW